MSSTNNPNLIFRFSTENLLERDRMAIWHDFCARKVMKLETEVIPEAPFHANISVQALPGLIAATGVFRGLLLRRTRALLADSNDDLVLVINRSGVALPAQDGREVRLEAGDAVLMASEETSTFLYPRAGADTVVLRMQRNALAERVAKVEDLTMQRIPRNSQALKLLTSYVRVLEESELQGRELQHLFVTHIHDLVALTLRSMHDATTVARTDSVQAALVHALKADIMERLGHLDLNVATLAARRGITVRTVQRLFEAEGTTFSKFVLTQRLIRANRLLSDPRFAARKISAIAFEVGFGDLSYFNRTFRRQFGIAPSEVRVEGALPPTAALNRPHPQDPERHRLVSDLSTASSRGSRWRGR